MNDDEIRVPVANPEIKAEWDLGGGAGSIGSDQASPEIQEAMIHGYCRVCGEQTETSDWRENKLFCSKACRAKRHSSLIKVPPMSSEQQFSELYIRAWHRPLKTMCEVTGIDYPADRVYVKMVEKNDYLFNAKLDEFILMTNIGNFHDVAGARIVEGDVVQVEGDAPWFGTVTYNKKVGSLIVKEHDGERILPVTEESQKQLTVIGDMFRHVGTITEKVEPQGITIEG